MQRDLVHFPADVLIRFQHRSNDGIPDRRPIVLFISNYRSSCPNRDSSRPLQDLQEQGTKTTFLLMPMWTLTILCIRHREDVFVHWLMRWILSFTIATNRISVVGAKPEPVPDVNGARFVKEAAVPVRVVRDVDKAGILEDIFKILLVQSSQKEDRHRDSRDFLSAEMRLYGGTKGDNECGELANV